MSTANPQTSRNAATPPAWKILALLACPVVVSSIFTMRDAAAPTLTGDPDARSSLVFDSYMRHEGPEPVPSQPMLTPYFTFVNKGSQPVVIKELVPSCGCLSPEISTRQVAPGEGGRLMLPIRTQNEPAGPREYLVTMKYEDPKPREVTLTYKVILPEKKIEIEPRVLMMMGRISSKDRSIITIADHRPERQTSPMKITSVVSSSSLFTVQSAGQSSAEGVSRQAIEVTYSDSIPLGQHKGVITVETDDAIFPILQIPVILGDRKRSEDEPVSVTPDAGRIILQSADPASSTGTTMTFTVPSKWRVTHADTFPTQLQARIVKTEPVSPGLVAVTVELSVAELPTRGIEQANLTLHATDGGEPEMATAPITLIWR